MRRLAAAPLNTLAAGFLELLDSANELRLAWVWKWFALASRLLTAVLLTAAVILLVGHQPSGQLFEGAACMFGVSLFAEIFAWACDVRKQALARTAPGPTA